MFPGFSLAAQGDTILVSRKSALDGGAGANDRSDNPAISGNGRYVAFQSDANNLSTADDNSVYNIFLRDTERRSTVLVSRESAATGGEGANNYSFHPAVSADGRYVAFQSSASNLGSQDDDDYDDIFLRDVQARTTTLVSRDEGPDGEESNNYSSNPSISADGRWVAFDSTATNWFGSCSCARRHIWVRDVVGAHTVLISRQSWDGSGSDDEPGNAYSLNPSISADGRHVAFESAATNLSTDDFDSTKDVFVRHRPTLTTELVSRADGPNGQAAGDDAAKASISADGGSVVFESPAKNLSGVDDAEWDVFMRDLAGDKTILVSRQSQSDGGAGANGDSREPSTSGDGRYVAFTCNCGNLGFVPRATPNVVVRDVVARTTRLAARQSPSDGGGVADGFSAYASISRSGRFVAFLSGARNLSNADDDSFDIFRHDFLGP